MKKRILAAGILMLMFIVTACGNDELVETPLVTDISVDENGNPLEVDEISLRHCQWYDHG